MTILVFILIAIRSVGGGGLAPCAHPAWPFGLFPPVAPVAGISRAINPLSQSPPLHCLIVGGGPDREDNEVAIESNVRYVRSLMPRNTKARVLYANGDLDSPIVQFDDKNGETHYRTSVLGHIDGPATAKAFSANLGVLANDHDDPLLLYFTGHGSPDREDNYKDNDYDLWGTGGLAVSDISQSLTAVVPTTPVTLVMVQCFSGGFADAFFSGSTKDQPNVHPGSGFFASVAQREAAGCTPEVDEADYHDFTTYFFGALTGHDRVGRPITGADYDHDGVVEMDEAYTYALINDRSIDTPVATSDAYVRLFTQTTNNQVFATSYTALLSWAGPAQLAALQALSTQLNLDGDGRLKIAYEIYLRRADRGEQAVSEEDDEETARWIRFVRLSKTVVLEHEIWTSGSPAVQAGLRKVRASEHQNPLIAGPPASVQPNQPTAPSALAK